MIGFIFVQDCGDTASNGTLLPEQQLTSSRPNVTFGLYEKTVNWYANVSWNPVKGAYPAQFLCLSLHLR